MTLFQDNKTWFSYFYVELLNLLEEINYIMDKVNDGENELLKDLLKNISNYRLLNICDNLKINLLMIERRNMKCVTFGKTSNGKSAVINALLGEKVLPSSIGRTTSCFITIKGCKENESYLEDTRGNRRDLSEIDILANEFDDNCDKINSCLHVYWPRQKCRLLENDLEILDSPGVDYTSENDEWIDRYCEDADVFVLVINGTSTLDQTERDFFMKIKAKIATPNIIVVINKWDTTENDPEDEKQMLKKQHVDTITEFLRDDLKLYKENNIENRIFFVSAKEALTKRENYSFAAFEECMMSEMTENAIKTKFKPHFDRAVATLIDVNDLIDTSIHGAGNNSQFDVSDERINQYESNINNVLSQCFKKISTETEMLICDNISDLKDSLEKVVEMKIDLSRFTIELLENKFPEKLSSIFSKHITNLESKVKEYFQELFRFPITSDQMKVYFNDKNDLNEVSSKYKHDIVFNLTDSSCSIRDLFKEQEASNSSTKRGIEIFRTVVQTLTSAAMLVRIFPAIIIPAAVINIAVGAIPLPSNEQIPGLILDEFKSFYQSLTKYFIEQYKNEAKEIIKKATVLFTDHLREIKATENEFLVKKNQCVELLHKMLNQSDEI